MGWFQERLETFTEAKRSKAALFAFVAVVSVSVIGHLWPDIQKTIESWVALPKAGGGRMTIFGIPILAWGVGFSGLCFGWWMLEYAVHLRKRLKPCLTVFYDDREPDCHKRALGSADGGKITKELHGIRLRIESASDVTVEQCSGFITDIEYKAKGGSFSKLPLYEASYLNWAFEEPNQYAPVTVFPKVPRLLGVCFAQEKEKGFRIPARHRSFVTPELFSDVGEYKIHIKIVAARCPSISVAMLVTWNGKWSDIKACLVESI